MIKEMLVVRRVARRLAAAPWRFLFPGFGPALERAAALADIRVTNADRMIVELKAANAALRSALDAAQADGRGDHGAARGAGARIVPLAIGDNVVPFRQRR